jgi:hypothetical protein
VPGLPVRSFHAEPQTVRFTSSTSLGIGRLQASLPPVAAYPVKQGTRENNALRSNAECWLRWRPHPRFSPLSHDDIYAGLTQLGSATRLPQSPNRLCSSACPTRRRASLTPCASPRPSSPRYAP